MAASSPALFPIAERIGTALTEKGASVEHSSQNVMMGSKELNFQSNLGD